ncbi:hypothetical protein KLUYMM157B_03115 [Kluyvera sp. M-M157-B]|nr:hypothetical protein WP8S18E06_23040 [Klebsiella sp. WP8-S18-ESBL-06]
MRAVVKPGKVSIMKKSIVCSATVIAALIGVGIIYSANHIAACHGEHRLDAACLAQAWDTEKVNPIAQFNPNYAVSDPVADTVFTASQAKR